VYAFVILCLSLYVPGRSLIVVSIGNCVGFFRMCKGGFGCSSGGGGGGVHCVLVFS
jgi:hypothetical protein